MVTRISISQNVARQVAEAAQKEDLKNNWLVSIAIVNDAGQLIHFTKMDESINASGDIAIAKAGAEFF